MNWTNKLSDLRVEALKELREVLKKDYDLRNKWQKSYENKKLNLDIKYLLVFIWMMGFIPFIL